MYISKIKFFCITAFICCSISISQTKPAIGAVKEPPITALFLELYKSNDKNISLGSMLLSIEMSNTISLEKFLRASVNNKNTQVERCIKLYTISKFASDYSDMKNFIASFPDDKDNFVALISFECSVTRCPHSNMLKYLIDFVNMDYEVINNTDIELKKMARKKIDKIIPLSDGWVSESIDSLLHDKGGM